MLPANSASSAIFKFDSTNWTTERKRRLPGRSVIMRMTFHTESPSYPLVGATSIDIVLDPRMHPYRMTR